MFHEIRLHKPDFDETWYDDNYVTRRITACYSRYNDIFSNKVFFSQKSRNIKVSDIFHELGLHKPDFDETWYDQNYVARRITACYSRYNVIFENEVLKKK